MGERREKGKEKEEPGASGRGEDHKCGPSLVLPNSLSPTSLWGLLCSALAPGEGALGRWMGLGWETRKAPRRKTKGLELVAGPQESGLGVGVPPAP